MMFRLLFVCLVFFGCTTNKVNVKVARERINEIKVYSLPQFSRYSENFNCESIINSKDVSVYSITEKSRIANIIGILDKSDLFPDTTLSQIDVRLRIEFLANNEVVKKVCWTPFERLEIEDQIFRYSRKIEGVLLSEKLIIKIIMD
ncbi:MAG: hypothetical protein KKA07_18070, partial [Bacteroidetes bacterium]|nr:hypothetical protein [Bacteroidota bacterium]